MSGQSEPVSHHPKIDAMYHPSTSIYLPTYLVVTNCLLPTYIYRNLLHPYQLNHGDVYGQIVTNVVSVSGLYSVKTTWKNTLTKGSNFLSKQVDFFLGKLDK
jgi:hypothetical protein